MAPDMSQLKDIGLDIGLAVLGIILYFFSSKNMILLLIAYMLITYGIAHILFKLSLNRMEKKRL